jgi:hypothetical protein
MQKKSGSNDQGAAHLCIVASRQPHIERAHDPQRHEERDAGQIVGLVGYRE